ncbi:hypothetical protein ACOMHN_018432 [Nucella lapillus]
MAWKRRHRHTMDNVWYFAGSCIFIFLFGNLIMLHSYHGFVDNNNNNNNDDAHRSHQVSRESVRTMVSGEEDVYSIRQLSRELLANSNLLQQTQHGTQQYFVMESRLRKLLENTVAQSNASKSVLFRVRDFSSGTVMLDCSDIEAISHREYVASGWTKAVFRGMYGGRAVALKTVDVGGQDVTACTEGGQSLQHCYHRAAQKIVKEIVLLQALAHHNVIQVLGFCVPDKPYDGDGDTSVVMVTELGEPIDLIKLLQMSWEDRLRISYDLTRLLHFLSQSARGALVMNDFRRQQFVLVDGALKLSDVDDAGFDEPSCTSDAQCVLHFSSANFTKRLPCVEGRCKDYNEYRNMFNAGRHFTTFLLPHGAPATLRPLIDAVVSAYETCSLTTRQLTQRMDRIVHLYRSGAYLNRSLSADFGTRYKAMAESDLPGQYDYRCRMSMSGGGCTLSVFDQREAEDLCDLDPECHAFVLTTQRTWTGRTLVHMKNGVGRPSSNPQTTLLVKPS